MVNTDTFKPQTVGTLLLHIVHCRSGGEMAIFFFPSNKEKIHCTIGLLPTYFFLQKLHGPIVLCHEATLALTVALQWISFARFKHQQHEFSKFSVNFHFEYLARKYFFAVLGVYSNFGIASMFGACLDTWVCRLWYSNFGWS